MWYASFIPGYLLNNGKVKDKKLNKMQNMIEHQNHFMQLLTLSLDTYKWNGLPETCNARFMEMMFAINGWACIHLDKDTGYESLGFLPKMWNKYGDPITGSAFGFFGGAVPCTCYADGSVIDGVDTVYSRCNITNYPIINYIKVYACRLADLMRSMDVLAKQLKSPFLIQCEESQKATIQKVMQDTQDNEIFIIASKMLDADIFKVIPTNVNSQNLIELRNHYVEIFNMFLTLIGISNISNSTKRERMIVAEAESNTEIVNDYLHEGLRERKKFCENLKKVFGLDVEVEINESREYRISDNHNCDDYDVEVDEEEEKEDE